MAKRWKMSSASPCGMDHLVPALETALGHPQGGLGLDLSVITPELTHALTVPAFAEFLTLHEASLAESHEQARKLAETFQTAS
jgi:FMN-dependent NADH-azoreductase